MDKIEDIVAESAAKTYRAIKALRKENLPKSVFKSKEKELQDQWWNDNKHLFVRDRGI